MALNMNTSVQAVRTTTVGNRVIEQTSVTYEVQKAYVKVLDVIGNKEMINFSLGFFDNKNGNLLYDKNFEFMPSLGENDPNFIKQAYEYLKAFPEFSEAVDC
jgi:hypothetical protein